MPSNVVSIRPSRINTRHLDPNRAHARIYSEWQHYDSWKSMDLLERAIHVDILKGFSKIVGNQVRLTVKGVMKEYGVGHSRAKKALRGLEEKGWICRIGLSPGPTGQAGGVYEILCLSPQGTPVTGPYMFWKEASSKQKR